MTATFTLLVNYNGKGSAPNLSLHQVEHIPIDANGDPTVFFDKPSVDCG